jgi:hypothetical protein
LSFKIAIDSTFLSKKGKGASRYVDGLLTHLALARQEIRDSTAIRRLYQQPPSIFEIMFHR